MTAQASVEKRLAELGEAIRGRQSLEGTVMGRVGALSLSRGAVRSGGRLLRRLAGAAAVCVLAVIGWRLIGSPRQVVSAFDELSAAIEKSQSQTANTILSHLRFYRAGEPFRETPKTENRTPAP